MSHYWREVISWYWCKVSQTIIKMTSHTLLIAGRTYVKWPNPKFTRTITLSFLKFMLYRDFGQYLGLLLSYSLENKYCHVAIWKSVLICKFWCYWTVLSTTTQITSVRHHSRFGLFSTRRFWYSDCQCSFGDISPPIGSVFSRLVRNKISGLVAGVSSVIFDSFQNFPPLGRASWRKIPHSSKITEERTATRLRFYI